MKGARFWEAVEVAFEYLCEIEGAKIFGKGG